MKPLKQKLRKTPTGDEILASDVTRSRLPFDIVRRYSGPREGRIEPYIAPITRIGKDQEALRRFDEAAQSVRPMLDNEDVGGAVGVLRGVE